MYKEKRKPRVRFCNLCAKEIEIYAYGVCFHPICYKCSTDLRVIQDDEKCPMCEVVLHRVLLSATCETQSSSNTPSQIHAAKLSNIADDGVWCDSMETYNHYVTFLRQKKSEAASSQMLVKSSNYISLVSEEVAKAVAQTAASGTMNLANPVNSRSLISEQFVKAIAKAEGQTEPSERKRIVIRDPRTMQDVTSDILQKPGEGKQVDWISMLQQHCPAASSRVTKQDTKTNPIGTEKLQGNDSLEKVAVETKNKNKPQEHAVKQLENSSTGTSSSANTVVATPEVKKEEKIPLLNGMIPNKLSYGQALKAGKASISPPKAENVAKAQETDGTIKGNGKVIKVSLAFGFIQRDYTVSNRSENVFFDLPACGLGPNDDLADMFELNDRVYFQAVPHKHDRSHAKWRATYVLKQPNEKGENIETGVVDNKSKNNKGHMTPPTAKQKVQKAELKGTIHCNLGPSFGFITPEGNSGTQYRDNVYFDLRSYIAEAGRHVHDLTQELRINETVYYELEDAEKSIHRPADKKFRAAVVRKCKDVQEKNGLLKEVLHTPTSSRDAKFVTTGKIPSASKSNENMSAAARENKKTVTHSQSANSTLIRSTIDADANLDSLDDFKAEPIGNFMDATSTGECEVLRNVLRELLRGISDSSLFDFDISLAAKNLFLKQVASIHFFQNQSPLIYTVLMPTAPLHHGISVHGVVGFDAGAVKRMRESEMIVQGEDDVYFVENSSIYMMLHKDAVGRVEDVFLHTGF